MRGKRPNNMLKPVFFRFFGLFMGMLLVLSGFWLPVGTLCVLAADEENRVFDQAGLFDDRETVTLEQAISEFRASWEADLAVITVEDAEGKTSQEYADDFYDSHNIGFGSKKSGVLLSIDMDNREICLSTFGEASSILTDRRVEQVLDAAYGPVSEGDYAEGVMAAAAQIERCMEAGVPAGQYYEVEKEKHRSLEWYEVLLALAVSGFAAALPCISTIHRYKMKEEQRQTLNYRMAYRGTSAFCFSLENETLLNRTVTRHRIPTNTGGPRTGGSGRSTAGRTTLHRSSSGRMHGGGSRKF